MNPVEIKYQEASVHLPKEHSRKPKRKRVSVEEAAEARRQREEERRRGYHWEYLPVREKSRMPGKLDVGHAYSDSLFPSGGSHLWEEQCFVCLETSSLVRCNHRCCTKAYHPLCLGLEQSPVAPWQCPWHQCLQCSGPSEAWCRHCPRAFCLQHNSLTEEPGVGHLCGEHEEELAFLKEAWGGGRLAELLPGPTQEHLDMWKLNKGIPPVPSLDCSDGAISLFSQCSNPQLLTAVGITPLDPGRGKEITKEAEMKNKVEVNNLNSEKVVQIEGVKENNYNTQEAEVKNKDTENNIITAEKNEDIRENNYDMNQAEKTGQVKWINLNKKENEHKEEKVRRLLGTSTRVTLIPETASLLSNTPSLNSMNEFHSQTNLVKPSSHPSLLRLPKETRVSLVSSPRPPTPVLLPLSPASLFHLKGFRCLVSGCTVGVTTRFSLYDHAAKVLNSCLYINQPFPQGAQEHCPAAADCPAPWVWSSCETH